MGFCSPNTWFCRTFGVTSFFFVCLVFLNKATAYTLDRIFTQNTSEHVAPGALLIVKLSCVLEGRNIGLTIPYLNIYVRFGWGDRFAHFPINPPHIFESHKFLKTEHWWRRYCILSGGVYYFEVFCRADKIFVIWRHYKRVWAYFHCACTDASA